MRRCGLWRVTKEGEGGPGNGPLAPVDVWRGQDVHVDVAGRGRKRLPQGIAVPPSVHKATFRRVLRKVLNNLWRAKGFTFKGDVWPPIGDPERHAGGAGPRSGASSLAPSNIDVRHTGSPPRGVSWQKLPRQGGESIGGAGAGAVEAMEKHLPGEHEQDTHGRRGFEQLREGTRQELRRRFPNKATARYRDEVMVSPRQLLSAAEPDDTVIMHKLVSYMREYGYDSHLQEDPIQVVIDKDGNPDIYDGNHRVVAANKAGLKRVPIELWYHGGSEQIPGVLTPLEKSCETC